MRKYQHDTAQVASEVSDKANDNQASGSPLVSAVILSWNRKDETLNCIEALKKQQYRPIEIVVLDNGSEDDSREAIRQEHPDVKLVCMPRNYGDWGGRDIAAANCRGSYMLQLDSDAELEDGALEKLVARMESEAELGVVQPRIVETHQSVSCYHWGYEGDSVNTSHYNATFHGCAALIRSAAYRKAGGYSHDMLLAGGESYLSWRMLDHGYRVLYWPEVSALHHFSPQQRIPHHRYFLETYHPLASIMANYPGVGRRALELIWKTAYYAIGAARRGYLFQLPGDMSRIVFHALRCWPRKPKLKRETIHLIDYLSSSLVGDGQDYENIDLQRSYFSQCVIRRLRIAGVPQASSPSQASG